MLNILPVDVMFVTNGAKKSICYLQNGLPARNYKNNIMPGGMFNVPIMFDSPLADVENLTLITAVAALMECHQVTIFCIIDRRKHTTLQKLIDPPSPPPPPPHPHQVYLRLDGVNVRAQHKGVKFFIDVTGDRIYGVLSGEIILNCAYK